MRNHAFMKPEVNSTTKHTDHIHLNDVVVWRYVWKYGAKHSSIDGDLIN